MKKNVTDWFDVGKIEHLESWNVLRETGAWPVGFIPEDVVCDEEWRFVITGRMAERYVDLMLSGRVSDIRVKYGVGVDRA